MRSFAIVVVLGVLVAACAGSEGASSEVESEVVSGLAGGCSREKILEDAEATRRTAIERGFRWLDAKVPYSKTGSRDGYRTDCSGFVSMCWELGASPSTATFYPGSSYNARLGSFDDLLPGDGLVRRSDGAGHVVLFLGWTNSAKTAACVLEQASTKNDMQFGARTVESLNSRGYRAIRPTKYASTPAQPERKEEPATKKCVPKPSAELCAAAKTKSGVECGLVPDGCGGWADCDFVAGFGCTGEPGCDPTNHCRGGGTDSSVTADGGTATTQRSETSKGEDSSDDRDDRDDRDDDGDGEVGADPEKEAEHEKTGPQVIASSGCNAAHGKSSGAPFVLAFLLVLGALRRGARTQGTRYWRTIAR
jgi:uncharacterized protein (TIGR03382 family)